MHDNQGGSTFCHHCGQRIIQRDWYLIREYHLSNDGRCNFCGTACAGRFDGPVGDWGRQRRPVHLADYHP